MRLLIVLAFISLNVFASLSENAFPLGPDEELTPGDTCRRPSEYRYPERIAYCNRNVTSETKAAVIREYDRSLGFHVAEMERQSFKIDHYIPLCMGGANTPKNLWPQHKSVYAQTDLLEDLICQLMAKGGIKQVEAIEIIRHVKNNLEDSEKIQSEITARLRHRMASN